MYTNSTCSSGVCLSVSLTRVCLELGYSAKNTLMFEMWTAAAVSWQRRESRRQVVWCTWAPNTQTDGAVSAWAVSPEWRDNYNRETHFTHLRPNLSINMLNDTLEDQLLYFIRTQIWFWQRINILRLLFHCSVKICFCQSDKSKWFQLYLKKKMVQ